ncbi:MAG: malectin [Actinomycetota bacterium]|nr:malectin [Actinomycetota bacterium]
MTSLKRTARWRSAILAVAATLLVPLIAAIGAAPAGANGGTPQNGVVSAVPSAGFPNITSGAVEAIAQVGTRIVVGGTFTTVTAPGSTAVLTRKYLLAFNATTGAIDTGFLPAVDGEVDAITAGPTSTSVYVGGRFTNVNGVKSKSLVLLNLADGTTVTSFKVPALNGIVQDLKVSNGRLFVAGTFTLAGPAAHAGLLTLKATTGVVDPFVNLQVSGHHNSTTSGGVVGAVGVVKIDISPDGSRLVAIGDFTQVSGLSRDQIMAVDISGATAVVNQSWATSTYTPPCYSAYYDGYMRAVQFSPDGSYFVVVTTGGYYGGSFQACDATARFETASTGTDVRPTWVSYTGTDSLYSVAVTGSAIYVGGHQRWLNNPLGQDNPGPGAVPRAGLAALEPETGVPMAWNPGRNPRGHGAEALLATPTGLWVGSDTPYIGDYRYNRGRLAYFPLAGGRQIVASNTGTLPGKVFLAGGLSNSANSNVLYRVNAAGSTLAANDGGPDWAADSGDNPSSLHNAGSNAATFSPVAHVAGTVPASTPSAIFDSERWGATTNPEMQWDFPVPAGAQVQVRLYFANRYSGTSQAGQRVFDVAIDGNTVLPQYDIVADAGDQTGTMKSFDVTSPANGDVQVGFTHGVENPLIDGIEIVRTDVPPSTVTATSVDDITSRTYDGATAVGPTTTLPGTGITWSQARGAFMINGKLYYGWADGNLYTRTFNGTTFGAATLVDPYNDPVWSNVQTGSGQTYRGTMTDFSSEIPNVTGMFYANGHVYYSLLGDPTLHSRAFSPDSGIVGSPESSVDSTLGWNNSSGMFLAGGQLYFATRSDGNLHRVAFANGQPNVATAAVVSGPGIDGNNWATRALFLQAP